MAQSIRATPDFDRIAALPRRDPVAGEDLVAQLTEYLRTPEGKMRLRPLQARALYDIGTCDGGFLPLDVGEGKTLVSLLAPYVLEARRPMMLLPANLIEKTGREAAELRRHWRIPTNIRLLSYQMLGLAEYADELERYAPDVLILDECHKVKNPRAAVSRRIARYMAAHADTRMVGMTGTVMRKSLRDFANVLRWCLRFGAPIPLASEDVDEWAQALDEKIDNEWSRVGAGALLRFASVEDVRDYGELIAARRGFRRRLRETPGVVCSAETGTDVRDKHGREIALHIRALRYDVLDTTEAHFEALRERAETPNGEELYEASEIWRHAKELALGFFQLWDPLPPDSWRVPRKAWFRFVREVLQHSSTWDSPEHVARACDAGRLPKQALDAWRAVRDSFVPNPVPVWYDDSALRVCAEWMRRGPGLVWTEHVPVARRLSEITGATYYGGEGKNDAGQLVDDGDPRASVIVSVDANREGRNLQRKWSRNLITSLSEGADLNHQLIGRTHRPGQIAAEVTVDILLGCAEHAKAWEKAIAAAVSIRDSVGSENKLLIALEGRAGSRVEWPSDDAIASWPGPRWGAAKNRREHAIGTR